MNSFQSTIQVPPVYVRVGRNYRARVRHLGSSGQWSNWSDPLEFIASEPDVNPYKEGLVITEIMYNPEDASASEKELGFSTSDFEFIELKNAGDITLDLTNIRFTKGIDFDFVNGNLNSLSPGQIIVLARNVNAFSSRYGNSDFVVGEYAPNNLSNGGENIKLSFGAGIPIREFEYIDDEPWPTGADGEGYSLVLKEPDTSPDHKEPGNWTISSVVGGSPGKDEIKYTYDLWKESMFTFEQIQDQLISGKSSDPDKDGFSNFLEYAFGGRALVKDNNLSPSAKIIIKEGAEFLAIEYQQRLGANDIIYVIEHSTDLSTWESVDRPGLEQIFDNGDGTISYSYRILNIDDLGKQSYLRVKVVGR